jgi:hypothetical protein
MVNLSGCLLSMRNYHSSVTLVVGYIMQVPVARGVKDSNSMRIVVQNNGGLAKGR